MGVKQSNQDVNNTIAELLTDRQAVNQGRATVSGLVTAIADDVMFRPRNAELSALATAISEGGDREAIWRGTRLSEMFAPESTIQLTSRTRRPWASFMGALASVAVFLPVGWTWLCLRAATDAYRALLASNSVHSESFIQLWVTGFDGALPEYQWLPHVAFWSTVLILLCVLLVVLERLMVRWGERRDEQAYSDCASRLGRALTLAQITVNSRNIQDPIQGLDVMQEAVDQLLKAHQQTCDAVDTMQQAVQAMAAATGVVASDLTDSVGAITTTLEHSVQGVATCLDTSVASATNALNTNITHIAEASSGIERAVAASATAQNALATAASGLDSNTQVMLATIRDQARTSADLIEKEIVRLGAEVMSFSSGVTRIDQSLAEHTSGIQHQITELTQARAALEHISKLLSGGRTLTASGTE